ncbi:copper resistance CopC family protein [Georgenia faecalis]|uniref:copper resistance CopC family protein n=1 Tax=Georgenia faecalis TaxID=2483799 RepID=UPI0013E002B0|nr:copper resistance CopC family protein [Georgenia faecalis]
MTAPSRPTGVVRSAFHGPVRLALATLALVLLALPTLVLPAQAHDALVASEPADGAVLDASPERVRLTFSGDVLDVGPVVVVTDATGDVVADGTPEVAGPDVTLPLASALPGGGYDVAWRVVSNDGHPIEGAFGFTVTGVAAEPTSPAAAPSPSPAATLAGSTDDVAPTQDPTNETPGTGLQGLPLWVRLLLAAAATGGVVALIVLVLRQLRENR